MPAFTPGARLHDRYQLEKLVGSGGMAQVWLAHDLVLGRQVAVKTLTGQAAADPVLRAGARREAQAAAKLTHPQITAVHDYAEVVASDGSVTPYLVMELLHGETLADRLMRGPVPWPQASRIGAQVAAALAAAHAQGVVHQDVKPANIMLTPSGVKVLDFGIAAITGQRNDSGWIIGTPAYSPPERLRQAPPDPSADVYGLGVILFEMATGHLPWSLSSWQDAHRHHGQRHPAPPLPPQVAPPIADAIRAALDPVPQRRPNAPALARILEGYRPTLIAPVGMPVAAAAAVPSPPTQRYEPAPPARRGASPGVVALAAVVALIVLIGGIYFVSGLLRTDQGTALTPSPSPSPSSEAAPAPTPTPTAAVAASTIPALLVSLRAAIDVGAATDQIDDGKARDLRKELTDLTRHWVQPSRRKDFVKKAKDFRDKVEDVEDDGEMSAALALTLYQLIDQLIEAGSQSSQG